MDKLIEIQTQISALEKKAAELQAKERDSVIQDLRAKMKAYSISLSDLGRGLGLKGKRAAAYNKFRQKRKKSKTKGFVPVRFRDPQTGETWTGRGRTPRWLAAHEQQGRSRESFKIAN